MARTAIPSIVSDYQNSSLIYSNAAMIPVDSMNGMYFVNPKNQINVFYVVNADAMTDITCTVTSVLDQAGRGNSSCDNLTTIAIPHGTTRMFGPLNPVWWNQPNGTVLVDFSASSMSIGVLAVQIA